MKQQINIVVVEGALEVPVSQKILSALSLTVEGIHFINKGGNSKFWKDASKYNQAATTAGPILGLTDLDHHPCPSGLIRKHLKRGKHEQFLLRIAEREVESWLLADVEAMARFLDLSVDLFPANPDVEIDPKLTLVNLARRSTKKSLREDLVPETGSKGMVGKGYILQMRRFVEERWRPLRAQHKSESLRRAIAAIKKATTNF
jgi:hypothetical protein